MTKPLVPLRLTRRVSFFDRDYFGRWSSMTFSPAECRGWYWRHTPGVDPIPIDWRILRYRWRRLCLYFEGRSLQFYEHIGVLRWMGLDGVIVESDTWPPYYGRPAELWSILKSSCEPSQEEHFRWVTVERPLIAFCRDSGRPLASTSILPLQRPRLVARIACNYPGLGKRSASFIIPAAGLEGLMEVYTQGWPRWLYRLSSLASSFGWPHHRHFTWPQDYVNSETMHRFILHRMIDLLGGLSLVDHERLLSGKVFSTCSGHFADVELIKQISSQKLLLHGI